MVKTVEGRLQAWEVYKRGLEKYHKAPPELDYTSGFKSTSPVLEQICLHKKFNTIHNIFSTSRRKSKKPALKLMGWRTHLVDYIYFKHEVRTPFTTSSPPVRRSLRSLC